MPHLQYTKSHAEQGPKAAGMQGYVLYYGAAPAVLCPECGTRPDQGPAPCPSREGSAPVSPAPSQQLQCHLVHTALFFRVINKTSAEKQIGVTTRFSTPEAGRYNSCCAVRYLCDTEQSRGGTAGEILLTSSKSLSRLLHLRGPLVRHISS